MSEPDIVAELYEAARVFPNCACSMLHEKAADEIERLMEEVDEARTAARWLCECHPYQERRSWAQSKWPWLEVSDE